MSDWKPDRTIIESVVMALMASLDMEEEFIKYMEEEDKKLR